MRALIAVVLVAAVLMPGAASAGSSTDAALGLGAFAVFNQILGGVGIFQRGPVVAPAPVVVAPAPVVVAPPPPPPVVVYPYYAPPVYAYPGPIYVTPGPTYYAPAPIVVHQRWRHHRDHEDDD